jgi:predicted YcjX-like family ATPase
MNKKGISFQNPEYNPKEVIEMQLQRLNQEIKLKEDLKQQLQELWEVFHSWEKPTLEQFVKSIELIRNQSDYFTQEQRIKLKTHYDRLSTVDAKEQANNWSQLIELFQAEMDNATPIDNPRVIELAKSWQEGINFFTGGDMGIMQSAERYYMDNPQAAKGSGMSGELYKYINEILSNIK